MVGGREKKEGGRGQNIKGAACRANEFQQDCFYL